MTAAVVVGAQPNTRTETNRTPFATPVVTPPTVPVASGECNGYERSSADHHVPPDFGEVGFRGRASRYRRLRHKSVSTPGCGGRLFGATAGKPRSINKHRLVRRG